MRADQESKQQLDRAKSKEVLFDTLRKTKKEQPLELLSGLREYCISIRGFPLDSQLDRLKFRLAKERARFKAKQERCSSNAPDGAELATLVIKEVYSNAHLLLENCLDEIEFWGNARDRTDASESLRVIWATLDLNSLESEQVGDAKTDPPS